MPCPRIYPTRFSFGRDQDTHEHIHISRPPLRPRLTQSCKDQLHVPLAFRQIRIKSPPGKLRPHHPAPVRPHRPIRREQAREQHGLRSQRAELGPLVVVEAGSEDRLDVGGLDGVDALLGVGEGGHDGVRLAVAAVDAAEVAFEEVAADRGFVDFVFAVEAPGHGEGVCSVGDGQAGVGTDENLETSFFEEDAEEAVEIVKGR